MSWVDFLLALLPGLLPIAIGFVLARRGWLNPDGLLPLLRYALVPALLLTLLLGPLAQRTVVLVGLVGVAIALVGYWGARLLPRLVHRELSPAAARMNLLGWTLPLAALTLGGKPTLGMTLAVVFVFVATTLVLSEHGEAGFGVLIRQPWLYAALAALLVRLVQVPSGTLVAMATPLAQASVVVLLVQLGCLFHPLPNVRDVEAWIAVALRLFVGLGLALLAVWLLPLPSAVGRAVLLAGLAPAATTEQALLVTSKEKTPRARQVSALSTWVALLTFIAWWAVGR